MDVKVDMRELAALRKLARVVNKLVTAEGSQRYWIWKDELLPALDRCRKWQETEEKLDG